MNSSEIDNSSRKKKKRSDSSSSPERPRIRSRSRDKKKSKKEKRSKRSRSKKAKRKRSKSNRSGKRKSKKDRSRSRSPSESEEKYNKYQPMPPMDPMMSQYLYYPPHMMGPRDRMRPPMFYPPPFTGDYGVRPIRPPMPLPLLTPISKPIEVATIEQPTDKIVKDQNFLNSDEKLFESIINNEMSIRTIFEDVQISENYAGTILYKTLKKVLHDPATVIFNGSTKSQDAINEPEKIILPNYNEKVKIAIDHIRNNNCYDRLSIDIGDMSGIREKLKNYRDMNLN